MPNKTQEKKRARESSSTDVEEESKILEKLSNIQLRIENGFTKVENEMAALKLELKQDILAIKSDLNDLKKSVDGAWKDIESLKKENESLKEQAASALTKNAKLNEEVSALKDRIIKQEDYSRRENLRFYNISENQGETNEECVSKVKDVINSLGMNPNEINFHAIHRVGNRRDRPTSSSNTNSAAAGEEQSQRSRPRPILARFISRRDVDAVWERKKELLKSPHFSSVFIDKDLSAESAIIRGKLRAAYRKAKDLNITRVSIKGNKLFVNSDSYSADKLPDFLLPSKDKSNQNTSSSPE